MANKAGSKSLDSIKGENLVLDENLRNDHSHNVTIPDNKAIAEKRKALRVQIGKIFKGEFDSGRVARALKKLERESPKDYINALSRLGTFFLPKVSEKTDLHKHSHEMTIEWKEEKTYIEPPTLDIIHSEESETNTGNNGKINGSESGKDNPTDG